MLLWVQGEISNLAAPRSGDLCLSLKDTHAQVCWPTRRLLHVGLRSLNAAG